MKILSLNRKTTNTLNIACNSAFFLPQRITQVYLFNIQPLLYYLFSKKLISVSLKQSVLQSPSINIFIIICRCYNSSPRFINLLQFLFFVFCTFSQRFWMMWKCVRELNKHLRLRRQSPQQINEMSNEFLISCIVEAIADIKSVIARTPISNEELYELMLDLQHISTGLKQRPINWTRGIHVE